MRSIQEKVCVVTGAAASIGLAVAARYGELGAKVAMLDISPQVKERASALCGAGGSAKGYAVDIADGAAVKRCFAEIESEWGPVYALVNNAGVSSQNLIEDVTPGEWEKVIAVNVYGTFNCIQAALPGMKRERQGKIINFSSKSGKTGSALMVPYSAAKGAVIAMTQAIACEVAPFHINCNCVCPGITDHTGVWSFVSSGYVKNLHMDREQVVKKFTEKVPLGRLTAIEDVVDYVEFLTVSADYCTGQALNISGGREMH